jgi:hypothetical protein
MVNISSSAKNAAHRAQRATGGWVETCARLGYATKGVIYMIIGVLATQAAIGAGGSTEGSKGAIMTIASQPFGRVLLGLAALGLIGYVIWRFVQACLDPEHQGRDVKGIVTRLGYAVSGIAYAVLAFFAARMALGMGGGGGGDSSQQELTARLMSQPFGQWLVGIVGAIIIGVGLFHFYRAYKANFMQAYGGGMSAAQRRWAKRIGQFGLSARGVTFCIIGDFLIIAAVQADPSETKGLGGALQTLAEQPYGPWLLGIVALGMVAYGVYNFSQARYKRVETR